MRSVRLHGPGDLRVDEVEDTHLGNEMIRIDVAYTGICGSDLHEYKIGPVPIRAEDTDHVVPESNWDELLPKNMGHEISGTVAEVGSAVNSVAVGDLVTMNFAMSCGECRYCRQGKPNLCSKGDGRVVSSPGFSENIAVPAQSAVSVPEGVSLRHAALAEPLGVSMHGVQRSGMSAGDTVAVFGVGPIGLGVIAAASAAGARDIWVSEPRTARREAAEKLGADHTLDPTAVDVRAKIREATGGVDVSFEAAGIGRTLTDALRATKYDGSVVILSVFEDEVSVHPNDIMQAERKLVGSMGFTAEPDSSFSTVLEFMADGRIDPEPLITGIVSLDETEDAFESLLEPDSDHIKVLVRP